MDIDSFSSALNEFLTQYNVVKGEDDGAISTQKKTREELKQDRTFTPGQHVKINANYGTKQNPHYLVGEFVEDVDTENVKVKLLSTGRSRTVNKKSIVLTESTLFDRILKESFGSLTKDSPIFYTFVDGKYEKIFLSEVKRALDDGKLVKVVDVLSDSLCLEIDE